MASKAQAASSGAPGPTIQARAWRTLLETYRELFPLLEREFRINTPIEVKYYDVMVHVSEGEDGRRMTEVAEGVVLSKSGLTSLVDRMEADGLVVRRPDPEDRRAIRLHLTPLGEERFAEASRHHRNVVQRVFASRISDEEARTLVDVLTRVREGIASGDAGAPA